MHHYRTIRTSSHSFGLSRLNPNAVRQWRIERTGVRSYLAVRDRADWRADNHHPDHRRPSIFCRIACGRPGYRARYVLRRNRHHCSRRNFPSGRTQAHGGRDRHPHAGSRRALRQPPHSRGLAEFVDRGGHRIHRTRMDLAGSTGRGLRVHPQGRLAQRDDRCAQSHPGRPDAGRPVDVQCCPGTDPECVSGQACPR